MKKYLLGLMLGLISISAFAEKIDGPANIRTEPKGELKFSLNDKVDIECTEFKNDWCEILVTIKLTKEQYNTNPLIFKKGTKLYNLQGKEIGETLVDLKVSSKMTTGGAPGVPNWYASELYGYTFKSNIRPESIVEPILTDLIKLNKSNLTFEILKNHLTEFQYTDGLVIPDYDFLTTYMIYENSIDDPSPLDRIRLVFENDALIAIIHSRELDLPDFKTYEIERGRKLTIIKQFADKENADFIEKNKQAYRGMD